MATVSAEVDITAPPARILDVLADLPHYPEWSSVHRRASVESRDDNGRPHRATMAVAAAGLTDQQTLDYTWSAHGVRWSLVCSTQQKRQQGSYSIRSHGHGVSRVRYDLTIDPRIPVPGIIVRQVMRGAVTAATEGLKRRVESG